MLSNDPSQECLAELPPAVALFVRSGTLEWVAASQPGIDVIVVDGDTSGRPSGRCVRPMPFAEVEPEMIAVITRLRTEGRRRASDVCHGVPKRIPHKAVECVGCGCTVWQVIESTVTTLESVDGAVRSVSTTGRRFACGNCQGPPEDDEELDDAYEEAQTDESRLADSARTVLDCWEHGDLAAAVRGLGAALEETGWDGA